MKIFGVDFTSSPQRSKPITCQHCELEQGVLRAGPLSEWDSFLEFEEALRLPGPWIAGIDFPFGQSRTFIENIGWPLTWAEYVAYVRSLTRSEFRAELDAYRKPRAYGDKEHRRRTDTAAASISPQKLYGAPVGLMFYEGAKRLLDARVTIPGLQDGDPERIVVEAYPGVLARQLIGSRSYKNDSRKKQTKDQRAARHDILEMIFDGALQSTHGLKVEASTTLAEDPTGDQLDALLCAIQAAWAWTKREDEFGAPRNYDALEGWIANPASCLI